MEWALTCMAVVVVVGASLLEWSGIRARMEEMERVIEVLAALTMPEEYIPESVKAANREMRERVKKAKEEMERSEKSES